MSNFQKFSKALRKHLDLNQFTAIQFGQISSIKNPLIHNI